jgi:hypothetical protein
VKDIVVALNLSTSYDRGRGSQNLIVGIELLLREEHFSLI